MRTFALRILLAAASIFLAFTGYLPALECSVIHRFSLPPGTPGIGAMVLGPDGEMWGATVAGGTHDKGTIFAVRKDGTGYRTVVSFTGPSGAAPAGGLVNDGVGSFWGTTSAGGEQNLGTLFKVSAATGELTTILSFTGTGGPNFGAAPYGGLTVGGAGFWGATSAGGASDAGTIFFINRTTLQFGSLIHFTGTTGVERGASPYGSLLNDDNGNLYGTTRFGGSDGKGTIFKFRMLDESLSVVWDFTGADGREPWGELMDDGAGRLWGTTRFGGASNLGSVFRFQMQTEEVTTMVSFDGGGQSGKGSEPLGGLLMDAFGDFWGTASLGGRNDRGVVFRVQSNGIFVAPIHFTGTNGLGTSGSFPAATLAGDGDGFLWGTAQSDGKSGRGAVFKVDPQSGGAVTMHVFDDAAAGLPGFLPQTALVSDGQGNFWGTTTRGGASGAGTIYKVNVETGALTTVKEFTGLGGAVTGAEPRGDLLLASDGNLWGTTRFGGTDNDGTIFKINPATGALTTVHSFVNFSTFLFGRSPLAGLVEDPSGNIWGTTSEGGESAGNGMGTIFRYIPRFNSFSLMYSFTGTTGPIFGVRPAARLVLDSAGNLHGTTSSTFFKVNPTSFEFTTTSLPPEPGVGSVAPVFIGTGDSVWGTMDGSNTTSLGVVFKSSTLGGSPSTTQFTGAEGANPRAGFVRESAQTLLGVASAGGANNLGSIYRLNESDSTLSAVASFTGVSGPVEGAAPSAALYVAAPGVYYGTASAGGGKGGGVIFKLLVGPSAMTLAATDITTTTATLRGTVSPNGLSTDVTFEWVEGFNSFTSTPAATLSPGTNDQPVSLSLTGLTPGATYYYRVTASNADVSVPRAGEILSFTTEIPPPVILSQSVRAPLTEKNVLEAKVEVGEGVSVSFEYGTTNPPAVGTTAVNLQAFEGAVQTSTGLAIGMPRGVPIYYRAVVTNRSATTRGPVQEFTIPVDPQSEILAVRGGALPGAGTDSRIQAGAVWSKIGVPAVTPRGRVVFLASWSAPKQGTAPAQTGTGIFVDNALYVKVGESAGLASGIVWKSFLDPVASDGPGGGVEIALLGKIAGPRVTGKNDSIVASTVGHLDSSDAMILSVVAREGDIAPECDDAKYAKFTSVGIVGDTGPGGQPVAVWRGTIANGTGNPKARASNNDAAWGLYRYQAVPILAVREGLRVPDSPTPNDTLKTFSLLQTIPGAMGASAGIGERDTVIYRYETAGKIKGLGVWQTAGSVAADGISSIPDSFTGADVFGGPEMWSDAGFPIVAPDGKIGTLSQIAAPATSGGTELIPSVTSFTPAGHDRIYTNTVLNLLPSGLNATYRKFNSLAVGWQPFSHLDPAGVAYTVQLTGTNIKASNDIALLWQPAVALDFQATVIAREGMQVTGMPAGTLWKDFTSLALPSGGVGPLFTATLKTGKGGVTSANDTGCWAVDSSATLRLLFRESDTIGGKKLRTFNILKAIPGSPGASRAYNAISQIVWQATFTDGSTAAIRTTVP